MLNISDKFSLAQLLCTIEQINSVIFSTENTKHRCGIKFIGHSASVSITIVAFDGLLSIYLLGKEILSSECLPDRVVKILLKNQIFNIITLLY